MNCGSDHETLVTSIPCNGTRTEGRQHFTVPPTALERFNNLVGMSMTTFCDPRSASNKDELEEAITAVIGALTDIAQAAGRPTRDKGHNAA